MHKLDGFRQPTNGIKGRSISRRRQHGMGMEIVEIRAHLLQLRLYRADRTPCRNWLACAFVEKAEEAEPEGFDGSQTALQATGKGDPAPRPSAAVMRWRRAAIPHLREWRADQRREISSVRNDAVQCHGTEDAIPGRNLLVDKSIATRMMPCLQIRLAGAK